MVPRTLTLGAVAAVAAAPISSLAAEHAAAAVACQAEFGDPTHHVILGAHSPTNQSDWPFGVQAKVTVQDGVSCTGNPLESFYSAWVMLLESSGGGFAQSGFVHQDLTVADPGIWQFGQSKQGTGIAPTTDWWLAAPPVAGSEYKYTTNMDDNLNAAVMLAGVNTIHTSDFDPFVEWAGPLAIEQGGEVDNQGSEIPGDVSNKTVFRDLQWHSATGWQPGWPASASLFAVNDDAAPNPPVYQLSVNNCGPTTCFSIWSE
jgi:hypothetical protein